MSHEVSVKSVALWVLSHLLWDVLVFVTSIVYARFRSQPAKYLQTTVGVLLSSAVVSIGAVLAINTTTNPSILYLVVGITHNASVLLFGVAFSMYLIEEVASKLVHRPISLHNVYLPSAAGGVVACGLLLISWLAYLLWEATHWLLRTLA
jgi:hypothetical protein